MDEDFIRGARAGAVAGLVIVDLAQIIILIFLLKAT